MFGMTIVSPSLYGSSLKAGIVAGGESEGRGRVEGGEERLTCNNMDYNS
jgi:hypothetical protein